MASDDGIDPILRFVTRSDWSLCNRSDFVLHALLLEVSNFWKKSSCDGFLEATAGGGFDGARSDEKCGGATRPLADGLEPLCWRTWDWVKNVLRELEIDKRPPGSVDTHSEEAKLFLVTRLISDQLLESACLKFKARLVGSHKDAIPPDAEDKHRFKKILEILHVIVAHTAEDYLAVRYDLPLVSAAAGDLLEAGRWESELRETSGPGLMNMAFLDAIDGAREFANHAISASAKNHHLAPMLLGEKAAPKKHSRADVPRAGTAAEAAWYVKRFDAFWRMAIAPDGRSPLEFLREVAPSLRRVRPVHRGRGIILPANHATPMLAAICTVDLTSRKEVLAVLVAQARALFDRAPWLQFAERPIFVHLPGRDEPIIAQFSGVLGDLKGAFIYAETDSFELANNLSANASNEIGSSLYSWLAESIWLIIDDPGALPTFVSHELKSLNTDEHRSLLPIPTSKQRGYTNWRVTDQELLIALVALFGLIKVCQTKFSRNVSRYSVRLSEEDTFAVGVAARLAELRGTIDRSAIASDLGKYTDRLTRAFSVSFTGNNFEVAIIGGVGIVQKSAVTRPALGIMCLVVDCESGIVHHAELKTGDTFIPRLVAQALEKAISKTGLRPREVHVFTSPFDHQIVEHLSNVAPIKIVEAAPQAERAALEFLQRGELFGASAELH